MDDREARSVLAQELAKYRGQTHADLQRLLKTPDTYEVPGAAGGTYQVEVQAFWDSRRGGDLRVRGAIDDKGWSAFRPTIEDFIMAPDGRFVGEDQGPATTSEPKATGSPRQAWLAMGLGFLTILAGVAQAGADEEFFPRFHFPLLNVAFGVPPVILGLLAVGARGRATRGPFLMRHVGTVSALFLAGALGTQALAECVVREERFDMTWSLTTYKLGSQDRTAVRLEFTDRPGWSTDIESKDLADYLVARGSPRVPVVFRVIRDFGKLREFKVIQVAARQDWTYNDHGGWTGNCGWRYSLTPEGEATGQAPIR